VLWRLIRRLRLVLGAQRRQRNENRDDEADVDDGGTAAAGEIGLDGVGFLANLFRKLFKVVDRPWKMFPLGIMFGLGFDTSSEIAILGIASIEGAQGTSMWLILIFPALFTGKHSCLDSVFAN
jgi:high-affinity nickel-transport protein